MACSRPRRGCGWAARAVPRPPGDRPDHSLQQADLQERDAEPAEQPVEHPGASSSRRRSSARRRSAAGRTRGRRTPARRRPAARRARSRLATTTPAITPPRVPKVRDHARTSSSPRLLAPSANTTNAVITAQNHWPGATRPPTRIATVPATATWIAVRVVGCSPRAPPVLRAPRRVPARRSVRARRQVRVVLHREGRRAEVRGRRGGRRTAMPTAGEPAPSSWSAISRDARAASATSWSSAAVTCATAGRAAASSGPSTSPSTAVTSAPTTARRPARAGAARRPLGRQFVERREGRAQ